MRVVTGMVHERAIAIRLVDSDDRCLSWKACDTSNKEIIKSTINMYQRFARSEQMENIVREFVSYVEECGPVSKALITPGDFAKRFKALLEETE